MALACTLAVPLASQSTAAAKKYRISGVVVNGATAAPLARVRMVMNPAGESSKETEITTGADGRFSFEALPAGMWTLHAERKGFPRQGYCERPGVPNSLTQVVTGPGGVSEGLTFRLDPPAVIAGRITDEAGEPVLAALEIIIGLETGKRQFQRIRNAATDEKGEYRIFDMPAVPCYLLAVAPAEASLAPTYYSNATDPQTATLLDLKPGEEYRADFMLRRSRGVSIGITGDTGSSIMMLSAEGPQGAEVILAQLDAGERAFHNIPAGRHKLTLFDGQTGAQSSRVIDVGTADLTVHVPFAALSVSARVRLESGDQSLLRNVAFFLHADGDYQTHARTVGPDGAVTIPGMAGGRYKFMLATGGMYVKSMASANARVVDGIVDVPESGAVKLDVVLAGDGGRVAGKVMAGGKPVAPARVVLAPRVDSTNSVDYRSYQTESDGSFEYTSIKPGDYILFATTDFKLEFGNPAAIRKYLAAGRAVHLEPKGSVEVQIAPQGY